MTRGLRGFLISSQTDFIGLHQLVSGSACHRCRLLQFLLTEKIKPDKMTDISSGISAVVFSSDVAKLAFIARNYFK